MINQPDPNLSAKFFHHLKPTLEIIEKNGRFEKIHGQKEAVYITIRAKGAKETHSREMRDEDKYRFPRAWAEFEKGNSPVDGTPLKALPFISPGQALELQSVDINTIEDLANLQESQIVNIRKGRFLQKQAKAYLAAMDVTEEIEEPDNPVESHYDDVVQDTVKAPKKKRGKAKK